MYYASNKLNYCMPLQTRLLNEPNRDCNAGVFCLRMNLPTLECSFCGLKFHIVCVSPPKHREDSCGCHRIPLMIDYSR